MVSHLDHHRDTEAVNPSVIPFHIIFPAKTSARFSSSRRLPDEPKNTGGGA